MSHITLIEPKMQVQDAKGQSIQLPVKFLNIDLLKQALQLACEGVGTVGTAIKDFSNHERAVDLSISTPAVKRGLGFMRKGSEYVMVADLWRIERQGTALLNKISQRYIQLSVSKAAQRQGYSVQAQEKEGTVKIIARRY